MEGRFELLEPTESERWVVVREDEFKSMVCRHMHRTWDGVQQCALEWQAESKSAATYGIHGVRFMGWDAESLVARFHSDVSDCGCPRCSRSIPQPIGLRLVIGEERESGRTIALPDDVAPALGDWAKWSLLLAKVVGFCDSLLRQGAPGPYRLYVCDERGRILGSVPTGNPKLSASEVGRPGMEDGVLSGQMAWREFEAVVQQWIDWNRGFGQVTFA